MQEKLENTNFWTIFDTFGNSIVFSVSYFRVGFNCLYSDNTCSPKVEELTGPIKI